ncbi:MAG: class I SAM-dependent methyltransferase, partial [Rhodospirillaceae bacterium]
LRLRLRRTLTPLRGTSAAAPAIRAIDPLSALLLRAVDGRRSMALLLLSHNLDKYLGGYGRCLRDLDAVVRSPAMASTLIDGRRFAAAFSLVRRSSFPDLPRLIRLSGARRLLDIGSGCGGLLLELAQTDAGFQGWGVEPNPHAVAISRRSAEELGVSQRIRFFEGSALALSAALPEEMIAGVEAISGASLLNEFFHGGPTRAEGLLRDVRRLFPGRLLFVADYYGRLGHVDEASAEMLHTLVHDLAQAASGQGVPPPSEAVWDAIYQSSGCERVGRITGAHNGTGWFIDTLRLVSPESAAD